jgi:hypothetical protein
VPIGHAGHQQAEVDRGGVCGQIAQRGVALEHVRLGRKSGRLDLEEVVHERQPRRAGLLRRGAHPGQFTGNRGGTTIDIEYWNVKSQLH